MQYTDYKETSAYFGKPGKPGTLYEVFDKVMQLNLENGAADHKLKAASRSTARSSPVSPKPI